MVFDPGRLPLVDLGLACKGCGYPLVGVTRWECPECGRGFTLDEYIPEGVMPPLYGDGKEVRSSTELIELFEAYEIPFMEVNSHFAGLYGGLEAFGDRRGKPVKVSRDRYFEAIDLVRRMKFNEQLPPPPPKAGHDAEREVDWSCGNCGEINPPTFDLCWNCMTPRGNAQCG